MTTIWRISFSTTTQCAPHYAAALELSCPTVSWMDLDEDGLVDVEGITEEEPDREAVLAALREAMPTEALPPVVIGPLPTETDWLALSYQSFPPRSLGRFWIYGSHVRERPPAGSWPLQIDAATAFGSGEHPTTAGCLHAIETLAKRQRFTNILDMGTGSGILAIAAARAFRAPVTAVDIDPESIRITRAHAQANGVAPLLHLQAGNGFKAPLARQRAQYGLLLANILAGHLRRMAKAGVAQVTPGGSIVLAGLLETQVAFVREAWQRQGCVLVHKDRRGEWTVLTLEKKG